MKVRRAGAALSGAALVMALSAPAGAQSAPQFSSYPAFSAKFNLVSEKFSLVSNIVVYNISGQTMTDVTLRQIYPEGVTVKETYQREIGTEETGAQASDGRVEGNVSTATVPSFRNRMWVAIPNELEIGRRLNQITFPGIEVSYTDAAGARQTVRLPDSSQDLFIYSNVVGGLERFLKKYNNISFEFQKALPARTEWEFAPIAASAQGRIPTGVIGTFPGSDQYNGHFRIRSGPPGDTLQLLVIYKQVKKKDRVNDRETALKRVGEYLRWCGEFDIPQDGLRVTQAEWKKYDAAWNLEGRWTDTIKQRLGEGPLRARIFFSPREDVEYYILGLAHGRALGAESATPAPDKEAALAGEIDRLIETFRSFIVPSSYDRR